MFIKTITLENVRAFERLEFNLSRPNGDQAGWTVFTGDNASGKSTLLKAIAVGLVGKDAARALQVSFNRWIREGQHEAHVELEIVRHPGDDSLVDKGRSPADHFSARLALKNGGRDVTIEEASPPGKPENYSTPQRTIWANNASGWFSCGYGPFRRVFGASPEATRQMVAPTTERFVTMFQEAASLSEVDQWLRSLSHKSLENKAEESEQLELLLEILRDDLMPNGITVDRVDSDGLWLIDKSGIRLPWSEISDGYRSAVALLADILRHLISAYGIAGLTDRDEKGRLYVKRTGVVLIDEIDAHLHPEWQRQIGFWLKQHFPRIQFLVTTHSPIICQAADENGLFVLPAPASGDAPRALTTEEYRHVIASRPDTILLTPAFGLTNTRSTKAVEARATYAALMSKQRAGAKLSPREAKQAKQLKLFAVEEP